MLSAFLVASAGPLLVASAVPPQCSQIGVDARRDCLKMDESSCETAGCCWGPVSPNPGNAPWCYYSNGPTPSPQPPSPQCAKIEVDDRVDCLKGDEGSCKATGCCWGPVSPNPGNAPWCYYSDRKAPQCTLAGEVQMPFSEAEMSEVRQHFSANLDVQGSGMVVAAPDHNTGPGGDYYFAWMRDGALSMNAFLQTALQLSDAEAKMDSWLSWVERGQNQPDPNNIDILTEPKFLIPSGKPYPGGWCRPQNDGPGLRAITLMAYAAVKPEIAQRAWAVAEVDLDWVAANWTSNGCDLWEEVKSDDFFWNRYTMRKALLQGAQAAAGRGDDSRAATYKGAAEAISKTLSGHVQENGLVCEDMQDRCTDTAVIEAFNVGDMDDGVFAPLSKEVVATLAGLSHSFCKLFKVNQDASSAGIPGVLFGRYPGDGYNGGNPWVLLTASAATLLYRQAKTLSEGSAPPQEVQAVLSKTLGREVTAKNLLGAGDAILLLMKKYLTNGMHMNEQIDRNTGSLTSAKDLTWNYANVLKAMKARGEAEHAMNSFIVV